MLDYWENHQEERRGEERRAGEERGERRSTGEVEEEWREEDRGGGE